MSFRPSAFRLALIALLAFCAAFSPLTAADPSEPAHIQQPIADLPLTNGRVLHGATIIRYEEKWVILKTLGGTGPVNYSMIAEPMRSRMLAERDGKTGEQTPPADTPAEITAAGVGTTVSGSAHSGTLEQPYWFASMRVEFIPKKYADTRINPTLGTHEKFEIVVAETTTDAEGKFSVPVPPGDYVVYATHPRRFPNGNHVQYEWVVELTVGTTPATVTLDDQNAKIAVDVPKPKKKA